ncbi:MAG: hypothetical protein ACQEV6_08175 [Pseudomonadota bacterium]
MIESLINKGVLVIGGSQGKPQSTKRIVVVGTARGGTSMVAGALHHLGVFMGDMAVAPVFEDTRLSEAFEAGPVPNIGAIAEEYDRAHRCWGWKRPSAIKYLDLVDHELNQPRYVFIFKDVFSIANRNSISMHTEILSGIKSACAQYSEVANFLESRSPHALLVSYDKALSDPDGFVRALCQFADVEVSDEEKEAAVNFIQPNPEQYLDMSRASKSQGFVDHCDRFVVKGWARYLYKDDSASIEIVVDGVKVGECVASIHRPDLQQHFNKDCAFEFRFPSPLSAGSNVQVRVENEIYELKNSPWLID